MRARDLAVTGAAWLLSGCDVLLLSPLAPGLLPGFGQPLRGQVVDSATGQPVGAASVVSDFGWTTTDNGGSFALYGSVSRRNISISRAGYTSATYANGAVLDDRAYFIDPLFPTPTAGDLTSRRIEILGTVTPKTGVPINGEVVFAGIKGGTINQNQFAIPELTVNLPGSVFSGVLAAGEVNNGPIVPPDKTAEQPFTFKDYGNGLLMFGYSFFDVPFQPTGTPQIPQWKAPVPIEIGTLGTVASITYKNAGWARDITVKTEITLDFGLLGSVPVARGLGSHQDLPIPSVAQAKYVLEGRAATLDGSRASIVVITTNSGLKETFDLLTPPEPTAPATGAGGVGGRPTFSWKAVPGADAYLVVLFEPNIPQPKWRGLTTDTSLAFPSFGEGDVNGGGLLPGIRYHWEVHAMSSRYGAATPRALDFDAFLPASYRDGSIGPRLRTPAEILGIGTRSSGPPFRPFRKKAFESLTRGMEFTR